VAQIDRRASALGRRTPIELGLVGDVRSTLTALPGIKTCPPATH
jgi:pyruvate dehydrogenase (quinone)